MDNVLALDTISALSIALALDCVLASDTPLSNAWRIGMGSVLKINMFIGNGYCIDIEKSIGNEPVAYIGIGPCNGNGLRLDNGWCLSNGPVYGI